MHDIRRKLLSQNFLSSRKLVAALIDNSFIGKQDLVVEIGPGRGIITEQLVKRAGHVMAVELDNQCFNHLQKKFPTTDNLTLYHADFLTHPLPKLPYKVFANIPFAIEGKIIHKLIEAQNPPTDCYLVVMSQLAYRLAQSKLTRSKTVFLKRETMFSALHRPWFDFSIAYHFRRFDFTPVPQVNAVLFRFTKKQLPLLPWAERKVYQRFVKRAFVNGRPLRNNLKTIYALDQIDACLQQLSLNKKVKPGRLHLEQWIALYLQLSEQSGRCHDQAKYRTLY